MDYDVEEGESLVYLKRPVSGRREGIGSESGSPIQTVNDGLKTCPCRP